MKVHVERNWANGDWCFYFFDHRGNHFYLGKPMELVMEEKSGYEHGMALGEEPTFRIGRDYEDVLGALAKALSDAGFRNDAGEKELATVLKAKDAHLEDMRTLVFKAKP